MFITYKNRWNNWLSKNKEIILNRAKDYYENNKEILKNKARS